MSSTMSTPERSRSIPPPPPPIDDNLSVEYGSMANTYSNNHMADDESVEAQHVVYTFAEESKSSKKGRKKCILLMLASIALFSVIVALGVVYGTQRKGRNNGTIAEANSSDTNQETSDGEDGSDAGATTPTNTELDEDIYDSPNFADSNSTDFEDDTLDEDEDEDLSAGNEITVAPDSTNTTTPPTNPTVPTIPDAGTPAPTIVNTGTVTTATTWTSSTATSTTGTRGGGGFQGGGGQFANQGQGGFQVGQGGAGQQRPNQNGFQGQAGAQGGFQGGAGAQGGFQQRPNQNGNQGGAGGQGGFQGGAGAQGGFQQRPNQVGFQGGVGNNGQVGRESDNVFGV